MSFLLEVSIVSATYCHHCHKYIKQQVFYNLLFLLNLLMKINPKQELCVTGPNVTMLCLKMLFTEQNGSSVLAQRFGPGRHVLSVASHEQRRLAGAAPPAGPRPRCPCVSGFPCRVGRNRHERLPRAPRPGQGPEHCPQAHGARLLPLVSCS